MSLFNYFDPELFAALLYSDSQFFSFIPLSLFLVALHRLDVVLARTVIAEKITKAAQTLDVHMGEMMKMKILAEEDFAPDFFDQMMMTTLDLEIESHMQKMMRQKLTNLNASRLLILKTLLGDLLVAQSDSQIHQEL